MVDHSQFKLGRKAVKTDTRTLNLRKYLGATLPTPPVAVDWTNGITSYGMMKNDSLGDCTIAGCGHAVQIWTANTGGEVTVSDATIESYYEKWDGYNPNDPSTDQGGIELDVLTDWKAQEFAGIPLLGFADPALANLKEIRTAINLFGGVYIGLNLPVTAQTQEVWDVLANGSSDAKPGSWGGHCVFVPTYDASSFTCITWGGLKKMTAAFWNSYCDEAHALLSTAWIEQNVPVKRFDLATLKADLALIR